MMFLVVTLLASSALATPALDRDECPTLKQIGQAFEKEFGVKIPEGIMDCVHGGSNCPFTSFEDFFGWFVSSTKLKIPEESIDVDKIMDACMSGKKGCPTLEEAVAFVQNELGANLDDETVQIIYKCADNILKQLGF